MKIRLLVFLFIISFCFEAVYSQTQCRPPEIVFNRNAPNIFNETQEMYLGEVMAETVEKEFRIINDETVNAYVRSIGEKIVKHLPPTSIKFSFHVVDVPDVNAFAVAGGRIYVTRKLVAFVRSEDELAGIIGHELGHGIVRHHSADISRLFKEILKVEQVGDRNDVFEKFNQFIDRQNTKRVKTKKNHEGDQQLEADRIGLYAMIAAGYEPKAYTSAWERLTENKKTGNSFTVFFGTTRPEEKRLREMIKAISTVTPECLNVKKTQTNAEFEKWQSYVVTNSNFRRQAKLKSLIGKHSLRPFLRGDVKHFQFSADGKYILAQDASGINILKREPFSYVFRIDTENAKNAFFTADSQFIMIQTYGLRVEKWSVEDRKPISTREVYVHGDCWQTALSPDGRYLTCFSGRASLNIINVETNEKVWSKEKFYVPSFFEFITWSFARSESEEKEINPLQMEFSPDGKYFLGGRVFRFSIGGSSSFGGILFTSWGINADQDSFIAYDLQQKKEVKLGGELKNIVSMPFAFYSNDKIIGQHRKDREKSGIFSFPAGERVEKFLMNADSYTKTHQGEYILVRPTNTNPVGVFDLQTKKFIASSKTPALDGYGDFFVSEGKDGIIDLHKVEASTKTMQEVGSLNLPKNDLGDVRTISLSPDFEWLALSEKSRGAVWNLKTNEMKIYIRGFRGSFFDTDGKIYADFPYFEKEPRSIAVLTPAQGTGAVLDAVETRNTKQHGRFLVRIKTKFDEKLEKKPKTDKDKKEQPEADMEAKAKPTFEFTEGFLTGLNLGGLGFEEGTMEVKDVRSGKLVWSKNFPNEIPRYKFDEEGATVALYWQLTTKAAKNEIKNKPHLNEKLKTLGEKEGDYLVQILNAETGELIGETLIETGEGSFSIESAAAAGDRLAITDSENRILLYSLATGELQRRFFGEKILINSVKPIAAVENFAGQLSIYNLDNGRKINDLVFPSSVVFTKFSRDGKKLFVLTADQNYYLFNAEGFELP